ncbi:hypothetical protein ZWY2020_023618 [Hordeum vulgare]|nr:hypothetical protein ZWY2020_023618 [Hordeum vulgare]
MEEYLATYTAKDPATPAQPAVQTASELPARAAGGHAQQAPGAAALPASSRGAVKSNISSVKTPGSSSNKRVIYIVDGDDGSHVPTLRQVQVYGEEGSKGYEMTPAPASNVVKQPRLDAGKQPVRRPRIQLISNMHQGQSTELMDDDEEASMALAVKLERNASYVDRSLQLETAEEFDVMEIDDLSSDDTGSESDSDSGSGSESEKEEGKFFYPGPEELGTVKAPQVGMKFPTLEDAHEYYNTYALQTGFVVVRGRNYKRQRFQLDCNRNRKDEAMAKAIAEVMPQARHRFCRWDRNAQEKMASFVAARVNMKAELDSLVDNSLTETEFEEGWSALIQRHDASENEYLQFLWEMRKTWAPVYFMQDFFPFVVSARGSQGAFSLFKEKVLLPKDKIENLIEKYEEMQDNIKKTDEEDAQQSATEPKCFSLQPIERHASRVYTRQIFLKVQKELLHSTAFKVREIEIGTLYRLEKASNYENPEYDRDFFEVWVEPGVNDTYTCQCAKFARDGILCCHVFRLFTQFGIDEIPEKYIMARWTDGCREEQLERCEEGRMVVAAVRREEDATRYAAMMSKAAGIGREICGDGAKCEAFMLELDRIREKMATMTMANDNF